MDAAEAVAPQVGVSRACRTFDVARCTLYRGRRPSAPRPASPRPKPPRALSEGERQAVLDMLHSDRFVDSSPAQAYATLLDEGQYLASERTMYRILAENGGVGERRNQLRHPAYAKPELLATGPNQVWSWDITKLLGPAKWTYYYLYVILDIFSRYAVGWTVAYRESSALAKELIDHTCLKQEIGPDTLTVHADRGSSMTSKPVALLLADLGVAKTHTRPYTSTDTILAQGNPYSEAQFKTLKYRPGFPTRFGSIQDARTFCQAFFRWYNHEHRHSGIAYMTPAALHYGTAHMLHDKRQTVLAQAYAAHPERFVRGQPRAPDLPEEVWINEPKRVEDASVITGRELSHWA